ncbi:hypothetical protein SKAU_G00247990 [Synaphobranchus kaupii]|uniref:Uncharacterized protein n=1 Tax=Synaphobranchus kaupii TaxID=118154 RepID=A0A9Q1IPI5_SYNKA|nr:hypothetical protein SKAU_G00247990 [Synaphobranchus kaupii]
MEQDWGLQGKGDCSRAGAGLESGEQAGEYWQRELGERLQEQTSRLAGTGRQDWTRHAREEMERPVCLEMDQDDFLELLFGPSVLYFLPGEREQQLAH